MIHTTQYTHELHTYTHTYVHTPVVRTQLHGDSQTFHPTHHGPYKKDDWITALRYDTCDRIATR